MFLWLWKNIKGYVTIEVTGFTVERFINMAARRGIYLWDITYTPSGVSMNVSIEGFKLLRECARKTKCKYRITKKNGVPFTIYKYRKRKILMGGILFFIALIYFLSSFVWLIDVKGNERILREDLIAFCKQQGLHIGAFKYRIDNKQLKTNLLNNFHDISWVDVHIRGTRAVIQLTETIPTRQVIDKDTPSNVIAAKDGLITSIVTGAGKPLVKQNDVVREGDILVSGEFMVEGDNGQIFKQVHAYSEVWAKMYTEINLEVPLTYDVKEYTGNSRRMFSMQVFGRDIDLFHSGIGFLNYDRSVNHTQLRFGEDYPLPVIWQTITYREFEPASRTRTIEEAGELAEKMLNARIIREFDFSADIVDKSIALQETPEKLIVKALITTNERIDIVEPIPTNDGNATHEGQ